jgi:hypothetical protein
MLDLNPSNDRFGLRYVDFGWNPRLVLEVVDLSIPIDLFGSRLYGLGNNIS